MNDPVIAIVFAIELHPEKLQKEVLEIAIFNFICGLETLDIENVLRKLSWQAVTQCFRIAHLDQSFKLVLRFGVH